MQLLLGLTLIGVSITLFIIREKLSKEK